MACTGGESCISGACLLVCVGGTTLCGTPSANYCTNLQRDNENCGACGQACAPGYACTNGLCCTTVETGCGGACVDTRTDVRNCGSCGNACPSGSVCNNGSCGFSCAGGSTNCGGACVDLSTDVRNCGTCGNACPVGMVCDGAGLCANACIATLTNCGGACVNTRIDRANCGACGVACAAGQECIQGRCSTSFYSEAFSSGNTYNGPSGPLPQCANWESWRTGLSGVYDQITIRGSYDPIGVTCRDRTIATALCNALGKAPSDPAATYGPVTCNGRYWAAAWCGSLIGQEITTANGVACNCGVGYAVRPCIVDPWANWGGVNTSTCDAPSQTMTVICQ